MFLLERCPHFRGVLREVSLERCPCFKNCSWGKKRCPYKRGVLISGVSLERGSTVRWPTSERAARVSESFFNGCPKAEREKVRLPSTRAPLTTSRTACSFSSGLNAAAQARGRNNSSIYTRSNPGLTMKVVAWQNKHGFRSYTGIVVCIMNIIMFHTYR